MKKLTKLLLLIFAVCVLSFTLVACGEGDPTPSPSQKPSAGISSTPSVGSSVPGAKPTAGVSVTPSSVGPAPGGPVASAIPSASVTPSASVKPTVIPTTGTSIPGRPSVVPSVTPSVGVSVPGVPGDPDPSEPPKKEWMVTAEQYKLALKLCGASNVQIALHGELKTEFGYFVYGGDRIVYDGPRTQIVGEGNFFVEQVDGRLCLWHTETNNGEWERLWDVENECPEIFQRYLTFATLDRAVTFFSKFAPPFEMLSFEGGAYYTHDKSICLEFHDGYLQNIRVEEQGVSMDVRIDYDHDAKVELPDGNGGSKPEEDPNDPNENPEDPNENPDLADGWLTEEELYNSIKTLCEAPLHAELTVRYLTEKGMQSASVTMLRQNRRLYLASEYGECYVEYSDFYSYVWTYDASRGMWCRRLISYKDISSHPTLPYWNALFSMEKVIREDIPDLFELISCLEKWVQIPLGAYVLHFYYGESKEYITGIRWRTEAPAIENAPSVEGSFSEYNYTEVFFPDNYYDYEDPTPSVTPTPTVTPTPSVTPTVQPTPTVMPSVTPSVEPKPVTYTVTFVQSGQANQIRVVEEGQTLTDIPTPAAQNGYTVAWNRTNFTNITGNLTVTAVFTPVPYTITYVLNGGEYFDGEPLNPTTYTVESATHELTACVYKGGYVFTGWYWDADLKDLATQIAQGTTGNLTLYAGWQEEPVYVYFVGNGGDLIPEEEGGAPTYLTLEKGESVTLPPVMFSYPGYTFMGWRKVFSPEDQVDFADRAQIVAQETMELFAVWQANENLLVFNGGGAESGSMEPITLKTGERISLPQNAFVKEGYSFKYWQAENERVYWDQEYFYMSADAVVTLTAVWEPKYKYVIFESNGATEGPSDESSWEPTGREMTVPYLSIYKTGYTLAGWSTTPDGEVEIAVNGSFIVGPSDPFTLYAVWKPNLNVIRYNKTVASATGSMQNQNAYVDSTVTLTPNAFALAGYTFKGWATEQDGEVAYEDGAEITLGYYQIDLYAVWEANVNSLILHANWGEETGTAVQSIPTNEIQKIIANPFARPGYTFKGWATQPNGEVEHRDTASYKMGAEAEYHLYAVWEGNLNTVIFNGNGATGGQMQPLQIRVDETASLTLNAFENRGYDFLGWATEQDGEVAYEDGAEYLMGMDAEVVLYAVWTLHLNTLHFVGNGADSGEMESITLYMGDEIILPEGAFTRNGYTFIGWSILGKVYKVGATFVMGHQAEVTISAVWEGNLNCIVLMGNGADTGNTERLWVNTGTSTTLPRCPFEKYGYVFVGWATQADGYAVYEDRDTYVVGPEPTVILYAVWQEYVTPGLIFRLSADERSYEVESYVGTDTEVYIPSVYNGKPVTAVYGFAYDSHVTKVELSKNLKTIGSMAFAATSITEIFLPEGLIEIGDRAFQNCKGLTEVNIPASVTVVDEYSFDGCAYLTKVTFADYSSLTTVGYRAFRGCAMHTMVFPAGLTTVEDVVFQNMHDKVMVYCEGQKPAHLSDTPFGECLDVIWDYKNNDLSACGYVYVEIAGARYRINGEEAILVDVYACGIPLLNIPAEVTYKDTQYPVTKVNYNTFDSRERSLYTEVKIPASVTDIAVGDWASSSYPIAFNSLSVQKFTVAADNPNFQSIDGNIYSKNGTTLYAYAAASERTEFTVPASVRKIYSRAFAYVQNLKRVVFPQDSALTWLDYEAFYQAQSLEEVVLSNVVVIDDKAFSECASLTQITIPDCLQNIVGYAFYNCTALHTVTISSNSQLVQMKGFEYCTALTELYVPAGVTDLSSFYNCTSLTSITVDANNQTYKSIDGNLYTKDGKTLLCYAAGKTETYFAVPEGVTTVEGISYARYLETVYIPASVTQEGNEGHNISFIDCPSLKNIIVDEDNPVFKSIDGNLYSKDGTVLYEYARGKTEAVFYVPDGVVKFDVTAITYADNLTTIYMPESVVTLPQYAVYLSEGKRIVVYYEGATTPEGWAYQWCYNGEGMCYRVVFNSEMPYLQ